LLPGGAGGTRFYRDLDGNAGMAFAGTATVGVAPGDNHSAWPDTVELHERAHLFQFYAPAPIARLMARMPPAAPGSYAATDPVEHFAEMAAAAWEIVASPDGFCIDGPPTVRLADAERTIPGTAGFVGWYLRHPEMASQDPAGALGAAARGLIRPWRAEWEDVWHALDARRSSDGRLAPWAAPTLREYLEARRRDARASGRWSDRVFGLLLTPSVALLAAVGQ
jgi:hypothetical protein